MIHIWKKIKEVFSVFFDSFFLQNIGFKFQSLYTSSITKFEDYKYRIIKHWKLHSRYPFTDAAVFIIGVILLPIFFIIIFCDFFTRTWNEEPFWFVKVFFFVVFIQFYIAGILPEPFLTNLALVSGIYTPYLIHYYCSLADVSMPLQLVITWFTVPFVTFFILRAASPRYIREEYLDPFGIDFYNRFVSAALYIFFFTLYIYSVEVPKTFFEFYYKARDILFNTRLFMFLKFLKRKCLEAESIFLDYAADTRLAKFFWTCVLLTKYFPDYWPDRFYDDVKLFFFKIPHTYTYNFFVKIYYKVRFKFLTSKFYNYIDDFYQFKLKPFLLRFIKKKQPVSLPLKLTPDQVRRLPPGTVIKPKPIRVTIAIRYKKFKKVAAEIYRVFIFNKKIYIFLALLVALFIFKYLDPMSFYVIFFLYMVVKAIFILVYIYLNKLVYIQILKIFYKNDP
jgi:hypothetical protein